MIYETGTINTTAGQTKITGTGTKWKDNLAGISEGCPVSFCVNNTVYMNTVLSINSDTEINLTYPVPVTSTNTKYQIVTVPLDSMSDGARKMLANQLYIQYFLRNMDAWMTQDGIVEIRTPTGETVRLESIKALKVLIDGKLDSSALKGYATTESVNTSLDEKQPKGDYAIKGDSYTKVESNIKFQPAGNYSTSQELKAGLDGKFDKVGGDIKGNTTVEGDVASKMGTYLVKLETRGNKTSIVSSKDYERFNIHTLQEKSGTLMHVGDFGWGGTGAGTAGNWDAAAVIENFRTGVSRIWRTEVGGSDYAYRYAPNLLFKTGDTFTNISTDIYTGITKITSGISANTTSYKHNTLWGSSNTTKDSNGNLKAASPVVKLFADDIELNEESEGVEMGHLGIGHYLIKGVVGFNADGAWGINNGFAIPQDHNGKNMVLIDYEVRPDGDIEVFVFHQQNADMPERFQNKRIKHFDEEGVPVYFQNYEPCDIPESRWIDMRVEMPPNSTYNQKQAEAQRLTKLEAERLAQEEAKRAAEEAERAEQEAAEQVEKQ
ncbi:hypothetical protein AB7W58_07205 [Providencia rettgeri]